MYSYLFPLINLIIHRPVYSCFFFCAMCKFHIFFVFFAFFCAFLNIDKLVHFVTYLFYCIKKRKIIPHDFPHCCLASLTGVEPAAFRLGGERSILLSYRDNYYNFSDKNSVHYLSKSLYESQAKDARGISSKFKIPCSQI